MSSGTEVLSIIKQLSRGKGESRRDRKQAAFCGGYFFHAQPPLSYSMQPFCSNHRDALRMKDCSCEA